MSKGAPSRHGNDLRRSCISCERGPQQLCVCVCFICVYISVCVQAVSMCIYTVCVCVADWCSWPETKGGFIILYSESLDRTGLSVSHSFNLVCIRGNLAAWVFISSGSRLHMKTVTHIHNWELTSSTTVCCWRARSRSHVAALCLIQVNSEQLELPRSFLTSDTAGDETVSQQGPFRSCSGAFCGVM